MRTATQPTRRELEYLAATLCFGRKEGALRMGLSESTLKNGLTRLYQKLGAFEGTEAAIMVGWLRIPDEYRLGAVAPPRRPSSREAERLADAVIAYVDGLLRPVPRTVL